MSPSKTIALGITTLAIMSSCVLASQSYAQAHPMDGLQLKMEYCIDMQRYEGQPIQDVGCKVGRGIGKRGVQQDVVRQLVARMNIYKDSYEYQQLISKDGLTMIFNDPSVGSKSKATVWQDRNGKIYTILERDE